MVGEVGLPALRDGSKSGWRLAVSSEKLGAAAICWLVMPGALCLPNVVRWERMRLRMGETNTIRGV